MDSSTRDYLAGYFSDLAERYSSPQRPEAAGRAETHSLSAGFYGLLADHIRRLPENDIRLLALSRLAGSDGQVGFSPGPRASAAIAETGRFLDGSPEPFLDYLVQAALDDRLDGQDHATLALIESAGGDTGGVW